MTSSKIVANAVRRQWIESGFAYDVVVLFKRRYSFENRWGDCEEIVTANSDSDLETVEFINDFDEGEECVSIEHIIPLSDTLELVRKAYETCNSTS